jgi:hypothetical protein
MSKQDHKCFAPLHYAVVLKFSNNALRFFLADAYVMDMEYKRLYVLCKQWDPGIQKFTLLDVGVFWRYITWPWVFGLDVISILLQFMQLYSLHIVYFSGEQFYSGSKIGRDHTEQWKWMMLKDTCSNACLFSSVNQDTLLLLNTIKLYPSLSMESQRLYGIVHEQTDKTNSERSRRTTAELQMAWDPGGFQNWYHLRDKLNVNVSVQ